jgi:hypothetical protein
MPFEFCTEVFGREVDDGNAILAYQTEQIVAAYPENLSSLALRYLVFPEQLHDQGFFGFLGQLFGRNLVDDFIRPLQREVFLS